MKSNLIESTLIYTKNNGAKVGSLPNMIYNEELGAWTIPHLGKYVPIVTTELSSVIRAGSKKNDIETGEDVKGT